MKNKSKYFKSLIDEFWYAPCDAYLRAPEVSMWQTVKKDVKKPILDIGCGDGRIDMHLFDGYKIDFGLDPEKDALQEAKKTGLYKKVIVSGAEKMPLKNNSVNTVISNSTFEHIKHIDKSIEEISRVLKKGGRLYFTTTTSDLLNEFKILGLKGEKLKRFNNRVCHFNYFSENLWKKKLDANGFEVVRVVRYFPPKLINIWLKLFRITTYKIRNRELWSYLKDSRISRYIPGFLVSKILYIILNPTFKNVFDKSGLWIYIEATKK